MFLRVLTVFFLILTFLFYTCDLNTERSIQTCNVHPSFILQLKTQIITIIISSSSSSS